MTRIWIDTEFNEYRGELISLALIDEDGREFYEVVPCPRPKPWIAEHVMPFLVKSPVRVAVMKQALGKWLQVYEAVHVVADWPEDIAHFCQALVIAPGCRIDTPPLTMEIRRDLDAESRQPHNALADVRAMRLVHLALEAQ